METQGFDIEGRSDVTAVAEGEECLNYYPGFLADAEDDRNAQLDDEFEANFFNGCGADWDNFSGKCD
jgi:hypothetical protein